MNLPPHKLVTSQREWFDCLHRLQQEPRLAVDLEANSMYAYKEQVCLIQITIPGQDYIVDPVADFDIEGFGQIIEDEAVEKIFHAAEYDLTLLKREYNWQCRHLFDTMWAARILGYERYGLASLLQDFYGVKQNKKFQKSNWCRRPLTAKQLSYAQRDTHHLLHLRDKLAQELEEKGHMAEALEIFREQTQVTPGNNDFDPNGFWSISGSYDLNRRQQAILKALYTFRDEEAKRRDQPLFKVFGDKTLYQLAQASPSNLQQMQDVYGMSNGQIRRYGRRLLKVIQDNKNAAPPPYPKRNKRPPEKVCNRYDKLHTWRKLKAQDRGVESDVILSKDAMWAIARLNPKSTTQLAPIEELGPWRRRAYGAEIIELLDSL